MKKIVFSKSIIDHIAKALAFAKYPEVNIDHKMCKTRWPHSPDDTLPGRDDSVPLAWEFAEEKRREAIIMLDALTEIIDTDVIEIIKHLRQIGSGGSHEPIPPDHRADMHDAADKLTEISVLLTALKN